MKMASTGYKVNRRTVRRCVRDNSITGVNMRACAINIVTVLGLHPVCSRSVLEQLTRLAKEDEIILNDAVLRLATEEERMQLAKNKQNLAIRAKRTKMRTAAKRYGGHRSLGLRTTRPMPANA